LNLDLKRKAQDFSYPGMEKRYRETIKWFSKPAPPVLDLGPGNAFGRKFTGRHGMAYEHTWEENLDDGLPPVMTDYSTVLAFELLEHLKNPDLLLRDLTEYLDPDALVYVSYPTHLCNWFWSPTHFHEFDKKRFQELVEGAGYAIVDHHSYFIWPSIKGIRPLLRFPLALLRMARQHFYVLKMK
jgi:hypothetical protein